MVTSFSIPEAIQVAHYWKFRCDLPYHVAVAHTSDLMTHSIVPTFLREWINHVKVSTQRADRAAVVQYLINLLETIP